MNRESVRSKREVLTWCDEYEEAKREFQIAMRGRMKKEIGSREECAVGNVSTARRALFS